MIRPTGVWTTHGGRTRRVVGRADQEKIWLGDPGSSEALERVAASEVARIIKIKTTASWRGGRVSVGDATNEGGYGFFTDDAELASRESLFGDQRRGWRGVAEACELLDVREDLMVLREPGGAHL